jgi:hypothetical protein
MMDNRTRYVTLVPDEAAGHPTSTQTSGSSPIRKSILTTAQSIDRHQLMDAPTDIVLTMSSSFAARWTITNVTLRGQLVPSSIVNAVTRNWHLVTLQPPSDGWVGVGGLRRSAALNDASRRNGSGTLEHVWCCVACRTFRVTSPLLWTPPSLTAWRCSPSSVAIIVLLCL